jgi:predicted 2-oxoglutarate/Fe(II)-dependent dioxygenase YbiX
MAEKADLPYLEPSFLDANTCQRIRRAMDAGVADDAQVLDAAIERRDDVRHATSIEIDDAVVREVEARLDDCRQAISDFYGVELSDREGAGFIRYPEGGFYAPHRDRADVPSWPGAARRRVAVVVFLNNASGTLRLFLDDSPVDVHPRAGMLAAFPADALHEVTVVQGSSRDVIVDWFY